MKNSQDITEVRSLGETLIALRDEINDAEEQLKELEKIMMMATMEMEKEKEQEIIEAKTMVQMKEEVQMDLILMQY